MGAPISKGHVSQTLLAVGRNILKSGTRGIPVDHVRNTMTVLFQVIWRHLVHLSQVWYQVTYLQKFTSVKL